MELHVFASPPAEIEYHEAGTLHRVDHIHFPTLSIYIYPKAFSSHLLAIARNFYSMVKQVMHHRISGPSWHYHKCSIHYEATDTN